MSITRVLMQPGRWDLRLSPNTPQSVLDSIAMYDHIVVLNNQLIPVSGFSDTNILSAATEGGYTGVITSRGDAYSLAGADLSWWLGDENDIGPILSTRKQRTSAANLSTWLDDILPANGITKGSVLNTGVTWAGNLPKYMSVRKALNKICRKTGAQWKMNMDGTISAAAPAILFNSTPDVIITGGAGNSFTGDSSDSYYPVEGASLVKSRDAEDVASDVIVVARNDAGGLIAEATATVTPSGVRWKTLTNGTPTRYKLVDSPGETSAEAVLLASDTLEDLRSSRIDIEVSTRTYNIARFVTPGDRVYVYDLAAGIYDTSNQIFSAGQRICPQLMKVRSLTIPIQRGMGVYIRTSGATPSFIDLTPYVEWEDDATTSWEVSTVGGANTFKRRSISGYGASSGRSNSLSTENEVITSRLAERDYDLNWTPTLTNAVIGTGGIAQNSGKWWYQDGLLTITGRAYFGTSGNSVTGTIKIDLPSGFTINTPAFADMVLGQCNFIDLLINSYSGIVLYSTSTQVELRALKADATYLTNVATSATVPFTWGTQDGFTFTAYIPVTRSI